MVDAKGMVKILPNNLNRKSPGNLPKPSFCSQGKRLANTTKATKITRTQRIMHDPFVGVCVNVLNKQIDQLL